MLFYIFVAFMGSESSVGGRADKKIFLMWILHLDHYSRIHPVQFPYSINSNFVVERGSLICRNPGFMKRSTLGPDLNYSDSLRNSRVVQMP